MTMIVAIVIVMLVLFIQEEENARLSAAKRRLGREVEELQETVDTMQRTARRYTL